MSTILLISLISLAVGFMAGAHYAYLLHKVQELYTALQQVSYDARRKNTGVVKPGLNAQPYREPEAAAERKSSVIRPRPPKLDEDDTNAALASVRNRVQ